MMLIDCAFFALSETGFSFCFDRVLECDGWVGAELCGISVGEVERQGVCNLLKAKCVFSHFTSLYSQT